MEAGSRRNSVGDGAKTGGWGGADHVGRDAGDAGTGGLCGNGETEEILHLGAHVLVDQTLRGNSYQQLRGNRWTLPRAVLPD